MMESDVIGQNVVVVECPQKGQVSQRAFGFSKAKNNLVLQMDDDIHLRPDCLANLERCIRRKNAIAVGPKLYDRVTGEYRSFLQPFGRPLGAFERLLGWVINGREGFQAGCISRAGVNIGLPEEFPNDAEVEWLPGGCVLHHRDNLILENYYPFSGKAFAEDLFHSHLLRKKGISLYRCKEAGADVFFGGSRQSLSIHLRDTRDYSRAMTAFCKEIGGSRVRFYTFLPLSLSKIIVGKLFSKRRHS